MPTISQLIRHSRFTKKEKSKSRALQNNPQKRGFILQHQKNLIQLYVKSQELDLLME